MIIAPFLSCDIPRSRRWVAPSTGMATHLAGCLAIWAPKNSGCFATGLSVLHRFLHESPVSVLEVRVTRSKTRIGDRIYQSDVMNWRFWDQLVEQDEWFWWNMQCNHLHSQKKLWTGGSNPVLGWNWNLIKPTGPNATTILKDTLLEHSCRTFLGVTFVGHLLESLAIARHPTVSGPFLASAPIPPNCIRCTATKRPSLGKKMQRGQSWVQRWQ